jgi:inorganic pyrophosphatase
VRVGGWGNRDEACQEIMASVEMFENAPEKPAF